MSGEMGGQVPNGGAQSRIGLGLESGEALTHGRSIGLRKPFHPAHLDIACTSAGKGIDRILVAKGFEGLTEYQGSLFFKIESPLSAADPRLRGSTDIHQQGHGHVTSMRAFLQVEAISSYMPGPTGAKIVDIRIEVELWAIQLLRVTPPSGAERLETPPERTDQPMVPA